MSQPQGGFHAPRHPAGVCPAVWVALGLLVAALPTRAWAGEVVVLRNSDLARFRAVEESFLASLGRPARQVLLAPGDMGPQVAATARGASIIFAIGSDIAQAAGELRLAPFLYAMVPTPETLPALAEAPGVPMRVPAAHQLALIQEVLPRARSVGLLFDPGRSGPLADEYAAALRGAGLRPVLKEVASGAELGPALRALLAEVDWLWLLPDDTVVNASTAQHIVRLALQGRVPVVGYSEKLAGTGALLSLEPSYEDIGRSAAAALHRMLQGAPAAPKAPGAVLYLNHRSAAALGVELPPVLRARAARVFGADGATPLTQLPEDA